METQNVPQPQAPEFETSRHNEHRQGFDLPFMPNCLMRACILAYIDLKYYVDKAMDVTNRLHGMSESTTLQNLTVGKLEKEKGRSSSTQLQPAKAYVGSVCPFGYNISFYAKSAANPANPIINKSRNRV
ncbi:hypothetical protein LguiA_001469 [Lonicera macranthoides]